MVPISDGIILVSEEGFGNGYRVKAKYKNGQKIRVGRLRYEERKGAFAFWQFSSGRYVRYCFSGTRAAMEEWCFENIDELFRIPEERLKRREGEVERIVPDAEKSGE